MKWEGLGIYKEKQKEWKGHFFPAFYSPCCWS